LLVVNVEKGEVALKLGEVKKQNEIQRMCWVTKDLEDEVCSIFLISPPPTKVVV